MLKSLPRNPATSKKRRLFGKHPSPQPNPTPSDQFVRRSENKLVTSLKGFGKKVVRNTGLMALLGAGLSIGMGAIGPIGGIALSFGTFLVARGAPPQSKAAGVASAAWLLSFPAIAGVGPIGLAAGAAAMGAIATTAHSAISALGKHL